MKSWAWILAPLAIAGIVLAVAFGAYRAGERHAGDDGRVVRVVSPTDGSTTNGTVQVVQLDGHRHWGFFPGFLFVPLVIILVLFVLFRFGRWRGGGGRWGGGPGGGHLDEWHRRQHGGSDPAQLLF